IDRDIAELYKVDTKALKQAVKRNIERFPESFCFELDKKEFADWRSQLGMRTNSWTQLEDASCILPKIKSPRLWKHFMI
ncbi:MAG: ORF6N domain-containing protein, partial [Alphaproteobacteria bacterium]|nr:ORF6N domain-containing protein [Alphaproteobacteria bacterium]